MEEVLPPTPNNNRLFLILGFILVGFLLIPLVIYLLKDKFTAQKTSYTSNKSNLVFAQTFTVDQNFNQKLQEGPFTCPATPSFCKDSKSFKKDYLSGNLSKDSSIYAAFDGEVKALRSFYSKDNYQEELVNILLTNNEKGLNAYYYFKGRPTKEGQVKEGDIIATSTGENLPIFDREKFVFQIIKLGTTAGSAYNLLEKDFK